MGAVLVCLILSLHAAGLQAAQLQRDGQGSNALRFTQDDIERDEEWALYKRAYHKVYESAEIEELRKLIFFKNLAGVVLHNYQAKLGEKSFTLGINKYSDMDHEEFVRTMNGYKGGNLESKGSTYMSPEQPIVLPVNVDWSTKGYVTPVKDQGQCGGCYSFSTTGAMEGQLFRKTGKLVSLSEQNILDCSGTWGNEACNGGLMDDSFQYIQDNGGIDTEDSYPYTAANGTCQYDSTQSGGTNTGHVDCPSGDESRLQEIVATIGPISVAIDASQPSFQSYSSGIYNETACSSSNLDHAVLVVGYGTTSDTNQDFWLVKNSWGVSWGIKGYIRMARNSKNQCGIATSASYPLV
jgi:cathepsin L